MRTWTVTAAVVCCVLGMAASAHATLVFNKGSDLTRATIWLAADDGSGARKVATGVAPRIAPDGQTIAYQTVYGPPGTRPQLRLVPAAGGKSVVALDPMWSPDTFAWSPDSKYVAAVTGREISTKRLMLIDVATLKARTIATGFFYGVSFSPTGGALVYSRSTRDDYPPRATLWVAPVDGGKPVRITRGHPDVYPLWGPNAVVFARQRKPVRKYDAWKQDLYLVSPADGAPRRLTHQNPSFLLSGLSPVSWSLDGSRLLAQFGGQDTTFAQTVDAATGKVRTVGSQAQSIIGTALSKDGSTVLATRGAFEPPSQTEVVTVPYGGGKMQVLARHAFNPDWNR